MCTGKKPIRGTYKYNCDDASKQNPRPSAIGFCIRDDSGNLKYAETKRISDGHNIIAKAKAIKAGLEYCISNHLIHVVTETNSLTMKKVLDGRWEAPWSIVMEVKCINMIRRNVNVTVEHVYRKGNQLTYYFTNLVVHFASTQSFNNNHEISSEGG